MAPVMGGCGVDEHWHVWCNAVSLPTSGLAGPGGGKVRLLMVQMCRVLVYVCAASLQMLPFALLLT